MRVPMLRARSKVSETSMSDSSAVLFAPNFSVSLPDWPDSRGGHQGGGHEGRLCPHAAEGGRECKGAKGALPRERSGELACLVCFGAPVHISMMRSFSALYSVTRLPRTVLGALLLLRRKQKLQAGAEPEPQGSGGRQAAPP